MHWSENGELTIAPRERLRDRLAAHVDRHRLDAALAAGAPPEASARLALRARRLTSISFRRELARTLRRLVCDVQAPAPRSLVRVAPQSTRVAAAVDVLTELADALAEPGPVSARGVAQAFLLLTDGAGPLFNRHSQGNVRDRGLAAFAHLRKGPELQSTRETNHADVSRYPLRNRRAAVSAEFFVWSLTNEQEVSVQDVQPIVTQYLEAFNETDADRRRVLLEALYTPDCTYTDPRRVLLEALYTPDCTYTDPHVDLQGLDQIDGFIAQTQQRFPGFTFKLGAAIDAHHNQARFQWHAGPADAPDACVGFDVIVTKDERIRNVYGFMDATPAA